jgi:DNA-binding CsgD family transcriptional regulator
VTTDADPYHKCEPCRILRDLLCQEGFCHGCMIWRQHHLTAVAVDCLQLVAKGMTDKEVGVHRGISAQTVKNHLADARRKLDARSTIQAILTAKDRGLIEP